VKGASELARKGSKGMVQCTCVMVASKHGQEVLIRITHLPPQSSSLSYILHTYVSALANREGGGTLLLFFLGHRMPLCVCARARHAWTTPIMPWRVWVWPSQYHQS